MQYISSTDARNNFSEVIDRANREPIIVQKKGRDAVVMISPQDYEKIRRQNVQEFQKICAEIGKSAQERGLTPEIFDEIMNERQ